MKVTDPSGQTWRIHRRWLPWNPRAHRWKPDRDFDIPDFGGVDDIAGALIVIVLAILLVLLLPILLVVLLTGLEFLLIALVLPFAIVGRIFFGKRWWVQIRRGWTLEHEEMVGDWAQSGQRIREAAKGLALKEPSVSATPEA